MLWEPKRIVTMRWLFEALKTYVVSQKDRLNKDDFFEQPKFKIKKIITIKCLKISFFHDLWATYISHFCTCIQLSSES